MLALLHDPGVPHGLRLDFEAAKVRGGATIEAFGVGAGFGPDLAYLAALLAAGGLDPLRVNAIRPGYTDSEMWGGLSALFLMTNPQVTGAVLEVSGGESLVDAL